jgi:hypothetical protein
MTHTFATDQSRDNEIDELKKAVTLLTQLVGSRMLETPPAEPTSSDSEVIEGANAAFKYKLLSNLMGARSDLATMTFTVVRDGAGAALGLKVVRKTGGPAGGTYLGGVGQNAEGSRIPFSLVLTADKVAGNLFTDLGIDVTKPFDSFQLEQGQNGIVVAIAPGLAAAAQVAVVRTNTGLTMQRGSVQGGTHLAGVGVDVNTAAKAFEVQLTNDAVTTAIVEGTGVVFNKRFEVFALHDGAGGPVVAIAPGLPAVGVVN